ncbi:hypothetical protein [Streptomyces anulatus]|nr:hypothetical protein [Streptomyces anulatus]
MATARLFARAILAAAFTATGLVMVLDLSPLGFLYLMAAVLAYPRQP